MTEVDTTLRTGADGADLETEKEIAPTSSRHHLACVLGEKLHERPQIKNEAIPT